MMFVSFFGTLEILYNLEFLAYAYDMIILQRERQLNQIERQLVKREHLKQSVVMRIRALEKRLKTTMMRTEY